MKSGCSVLEGSFLFSLNSLIQERKSSGKQKNPNILKRDDLALTVSAKAATKLSVALLLKSGLDNIEPKTNSNLIGYEGFWNSAEVGYPISLHIIILL